MAQEREEIRFPASTPDKSLKPGSVGFRQFAHFTLALSDVVESVVNCARDAIRLDDDETYAVNFVRLDDESIDWVVALPLILLQFFEPVLGALEARDVTNLEPTVAKKIVETQKVARRHGWDWGLEIQSAGKRADVSASEEIKWTTRIFRYATTMRATVINVGNIEARVRFRLMNGRTYQSRIPRHFAKSLTTFEDYMFTGEAFADADTLEIIDFKVESAEPVGDRRNLDASLRRLAEWARPEFITTDTNEFFEEQG